MLSWGLRQGIMVTLVLGAPPGDHGNPYLGGSARGLWVSLVLGAPPGDHGNPCLGGSARGSGYSLSWGLRQEIRESKKKEKKLSENEKNC